MPKSRNDTSAIKAGGVPTKFRTIAELRRDHWNHKRYTFSAKHKSQSKQPDTVSEKHRSQSKQSDASDEQPQTMRSLGELIQSYQRYRESRVEGSSINSLESITYSRSTLLGHRRFAMLRSIPSEDSVGIHCIGLAMPPTPSLALNYVEDPRLDDCNLLVQMEERWSKENGADAKNQETFGEWLGAWNFEEAFEASEKFWAPPLKLEHCASTVAGSRTQSGCPSCTSESSTPRTTAAGVHAFRSTLRANAPTFHPNDSQSFVLRVDAPAFYPINSGTTELAIFQ